MNALVQGFCYIIMIAKLVFTLDLYKIESLFKSSLVLVKKLFRNLELRPLKLKRNKSHLMFNETCYNNCWMLWQNFDVNANDFQIWMTYKLIVLWLLNWNIDVNAYLNQIISCHGFIWSKYIFFSFILRVSTFFRDPILIGQVIKYFVP